MRAFGMPSKRGRERISWRPLKRVLTLTGWAPLVLGGISIALLTLLNGEWATLGSEWLKRVLIASAQVGVMALLIHQLGLLRPSGLLLRSPIAPSAREVGLILLLIIAFVSLFGLRLASAIADGGALTPRHGFLSFAPLLAGGMLMSALIQPVVALLCFTVLLAGVAVAMNLPITTFGVVGLVGWSGIFGVAGLRRRSQIVWVGALVSALLAVLSAVVAWQFGSTLLEGARSAFWGAVGGVGATALFWLGLTLLERPFQLATPMALMELASPEQPLLRELREKAPGTYFHSLHVGQLAEEAALAIGADALLARIAGYYHDVGKLTKPDFYIENQSGVNTHERINPTLSAMIIASHVRDGVELARRHRLPVAVRDIIAQHHGTSLITYFYHQAIGDGYDPVLEQHFRYDGPKPQTREAGIVMLADTVEAATRSLGEVSPARLANFVHEMVMMRLQDGQLDESALTFRDLSLIEEAFVRVLVATRHRRIEYTPSSPPDEGENAYVAQSV